MFRKLMATGSSSSSLILRLALGAVLLVHSFQQTFGWLGGRGFTGYMNYYTGPTYHIPWIFAIGGILTISIGSLMLIAGLWTRVIAFLDGVFLLVAMLTTHINNGFFMNWEGLKTGEGYEYHILGIGMAIALVIYGGGKLSLDRYLSRNREKTLAH